MAYLWQLSLNSSTRQMRKQHNSSIERMNRSLMRKPSSSIHGRWPRPHYVTINLWQQDILYHAVLIFTETWWFDTVSQRTRRFMSHCIIICHYQRNVPQHFYLLDILVRYGTSASSCQFMSSPYFSNCTISINERKESIYIYFVQFL